MKPVADRSPLRAHHWFWLSVVAMTGVVSWLAPPTPDALARVEAGTYPVLIDNLSYLGNASCSASDCHGGTAKQQSGQLIGDESTIFAKSDPHIGAYKSLANAESKKIAAAMNIADAAKSDKCLTCHAMNVPRKFQGADFDIANAVGCESCHGPAEKWKEPHAKAGWTSAERGKVKAKGLLDQYGLVDTSHLAVRAHTCVACHLSIDKAMIDAGHPQLEFELYAYNNFYVSKYAKNANVQFAQHWNQPEGVRYGAKLWAAGQFAAHEAAKGNAGGGVADSTKAVYAAGVEVATKHLNVKSAAEAHEASPTREQCIAAAKALAEFAPKAANDRERRIIAFGVIALGASAYDDGKGQNASDNFWAQYDHAAAGKEGADYLNAIKTMAAELK